MLESASDLSGILGGVLLQTSEASSWQKGKDIWIKRARFIALAPRKCLEGQALLHRRVFTSSCNETGVLAGGLESHGSLRHLQVSLAQNDSGQLN